MVNHNPVELTDEIVEECLQHITGEISGLPASFCRNKEINPVTKNFVDNADMRKAIADFSSIRAYVARQVKVLTMNIIFKSNKYCRRRKGFRSKSVKVAKWTYSGNLIKEYVYDHKNPNYNVDTVRHNIKEKHRTGKRKNHTSQPFQKLHTVCREILKERAKQQAQQIIQQALQNQNLQQGQNVKLDSEPLRRYKDDIETHYDWLSLSFVLKLSFTIGLSYVFLKYFKLI